MFGRFDYFSTKDWWFFEKDELNRSIAFKLKYLTKSPQAKSLIQTYIDPEMLEIAFLGNAAS